MRHTVTRWLEDVPIHDPLARRQAHLFQLTLLIILAACGIGLPFGYATDGRTELIAYPLLMACCIVALLVLRRGHTARAVLLATLGMVVSVAVPLFVSGLVNSPDTLTSLAVPVAIASLLLGGRGSVYSFSMIAVLLLGLALLETFTRGIVGSMPLQLTPLPVALTVLLFLGVLCLLLTNFSSALRAALAGTQAREQELERLRASLEATVGERTAALQQALADVEQREARLVQALDDVRTSQHVILELRTPTIPVLPGVLVVPLVGALDGQRTASVTHTILSAVERERAHELILDVTGVPLLDSEGAQVLISTTDAARLLGARVWMVGVRPEVAQTIVALGIDLRALQTSANLREAIARLNTNA